MNDRERMLRACRGEWADRLPRAPRIDLWDYANSLRGTLPSRYPPGLSLDEIAPGDRFIPGISDTTPPNAKFERLLRITEMVHREGKLPMKA